MRLMAILTGLRVDPDPAVGLRLVSVTEPIEASVAALVEARTVDQVVLSEDVAAVLVVSGDPESRNLETNRHATAISDRYLRGFAIHDRVYGVALFLGPLDDEGQYTDVPKALVDFAQRLVRPANV